MFSDISSTAHGATITDCFPFSYLNRFHYLFEAKNLRYLDQIYNTMATFISQDISQDTTRRFRRKGGWCRFGNFLNIGSNEDHETLHQNIQTLQGATQLGFDQFASNVHKFHSFAHLTNQHLQELNAAVNKQASFSYRNQRHTNVAITFLLHMILQLTEYTDGYDIAAKRIYSNLGLL